MYIRKFHDVFCNAILIIAIKPTAKEGINATSHLYYILQKYYLNKNCMSSEHKN